MGGTDLSLSAPGSQANGNELALSAQGGALPFQANSVLPARPNLPDDPVIPHNGFATVEEGEKAFMHLLRKAGVDANWTWDQTMRAIITDPLYKALNTLAEKKAAWQKVRANVHRFQFRIHNGVFDSTPTTFERKSRRSATLASRSCAPRSGTCSRGTRMSSTTVRLLLPTSYSRNIRYGSRRRSKPSAG